MVSRGISWYWPTLLFLISGLTLFSFLTRPNALPDLERASGAVTEAELPEPLRRGRSGFTEPHRFSLRNVDLRFCYSDTRNSFVRDNLKRGALVDVVYEVPTQGTAVVWGLTLNGQSVTTPAEKFQRARDPSTLGVAIVCAILGTVLALRGRSTASSQKKAR
jgi:hypothetical protein